VAYNSHKFRIEHDFLLSQNYGLQLKGLVQKWCSFRNAKRYFVTPWIRKQSWTFHYTIWIQSFVSFVNAVLTQILINYPVKMAVVWAVAPCSLVDVYQTTRHYNPEDSHLRNHRRENLKSYNLSSICLFLLCEAISISGGSIPSSGVSGLLGDGKPV
jgi:hypothetical protein